MECAERGLIDAPWLRFGDAGALLRALTEIGAREGLGALLAEGSRRAAQQVGGGSADFAPHAKGLELPGYEPRTMHAMALGLAVNSRGADHNRSGAYEADLSGDLDRFAGGDAQVAAAVETEDRAAVMDSLILCKFLRGVFREPFEEWAALPLAQAVGRVTAEPVWATRSSPPFDAAGMDGIAVRAADTAGASETTPVFLDPGGYDVVDTGDPMPGVRDAVVMREHVHYVGGTAELRAAVPPYQHVRSIGEDVSTAELLLPEGTGCGRWTWLPPRPRAPPNCWCAALRWWPCCPPATRCGQSARRPARARSSTQTR
jgi:hypothetical protein